MQIDLQVFRWLHVLNAGEVKFVRNAIFLAIVLLLLTPLARAQAPVASAPPLGQLLGLKGVVTFVDVQFLKANVTGHSKGTGFFVYFPDSRLRDNTGFLYLITNRHVVQPEEHGTRFPVTGNSIRLNLKVPTQGQGSEEIPLPIGPLLRWYFPTDDSVDLAALPFAPDPQKYYYQPIPTSLFAMGDRVPGHTIIEGDPVLFVGYFYRFPGLRRLEPIVREGVLAMRPEEEMVTTLQKMGRLYLADCHVLGGNSGAPLFVNVAIRRGREEYITDYPYRLLGVVSGYFFEDVNFNLTVATTLHGTGQENSGISTVVPVEELETFLESPELQRLRDAEAARVRPR